MFYVIIKSYFKRNQTKNLFVTDLYYRHSKETFFWLFKPAEESFHTLWLHKIKTKENSNEKMIRFLIALKVTFYLSSLKGLLCLSVFMTLLKLF